MSSAQHVEMKVKHALATMHTGIDDETVPGIGNPFQFRNLVTSEHQMPNEANIRILQFGHRSHMLSGNDERMRRRLGIDIVKCNHQIVFIDECCGNGPRDDFAEEAFTHEVSPFLKPDFPNRAASSR